MKITEVNRAIIYSLVSKIVPHNIVSTLNCSLAHSAHYPFLKLLLVIFKMQDSSQTLTLRTLHIILQLHP